MTLVYYGSAIDTLTKLHDQCPKDQGDDVYLHVLQLLINAAMDRVNVELGFKKPELAVGGRGEGDGPRVGEEDAFYAQNPIVDH